MNWINTPAATPLLVAAFILFSASGSLALRVAGQCHGFPAVAYFLGGNISGFVAAIILTVTLRGRHPNIIYALCLGGGFCALQLAASGLFRIPLTAWQWLGVTLIAAGVVCLQLRQ